MLEPDAISGENRSYLKQFLDVFPDWIIRISLWTITKLKRQENKIQIM